MKLLFIHRYFYPDAAPYGLMLNEIGKHLISQGHNIDVLAGKPSYKSIGESTLKNKEVCLGGTIFRMDLGRDSSGLKRIKNTLLLMLGVILRVSLKRYDAIMVSTYPPVVLPFFVACLTKLLRIRFIYHCMDLHPEIGQLSGEFSKGSIYRLLRYLDMRSCEAARPVIVLSEDMKRSIRERDFLNEPEIIVLNNFSLLDNFRLPNRLNEYPSLSVKDPQIFTVVYCGNIGRFQNLDILVAAYAHLKRYKNIKLILVGDGSQKQMLAERANADRSNVYFYPHRQPEDLRSLISVGDIFYVGLEPYIYQYAFPSKLAFYAYNHCPMLVAMEKKSSLSELVSNYGAGVIVETRNSNLMADMILELSQNIAKLEQMKACSYKLWRENFSTEVIFPTWSNLFCDDADAK